MGVLKMISIELLLLWFSPPTFFYLFAVVQEIELSKAQWIALFEPYMFFESYKNYLQVDIVAADADDLRSWKGWVESRLRQLTLMVLSTAFSQLK